MMLKFLALLFMQVNIIPPHELLRAMPRSSLRRETRLQDFSPPEDLWSNHLKGAVTYKKPLLLNAKHLLH
ncbi:hypothetical protein SAMD00079811_71090 [Scytonema sp. HK-05]|nr:hypothetical protein SAMD00079811_71090 [Scytonema sp. HK-05]